MFTGIIESLGGVQSIREEGTNKHFTVASSISHELKVDQSLSHNGVCLTVVAIGPGTHTVTAVEETLIRSNLGTLKVGDLVNLERAMLAGARLDGHLVQGHVDGKGRCLAVEPRDGSWYFHFSYDPTPEHLLVDKGSICVNGVSLTVIAAPAPVRWENKGSASKQRSEVRLKEQFSVAIIPYTYEHTTFHNLKAGDEVNLEFDIIGKYIGRYLAVYGKGGLLMG